MKFLIVLIISIFIALQIQAQQPATKKTAEVKITTSAQCDMCKERIEKALYKLKGVISASVNVESKVSTVVYRTSKIDIQTLRKAINDAGYDADDSPAKADSYSKLPECCQKEGDNIHHH